MKPSRTRRELRSRIPPDIAAPHACYQSWRMLPYEQGLLCRLMVVSRNNAEPVPSRDERGLPVVVGTNKGEPTAQKSKMG